MVRLLCLAVGYVFGLFQTGYLYGKTQGIDIRKEGSGNSGATNSLRVLGLKAGIIVFVGDLLKTVIPCLAVLLLARRSAPELAYLYLLYTAFGVVLGHNYPFYLNFKGGKGIACTAGLMLCIHFGISMGLFAMFLVIVAFTRYVSLGSLAAVTGVLISMVCLAVNGTLGLSGAVVPEFCVLACLWAALAFWRHRSNIVRLLHGTENKISLHSGSEKKE